MSPRESFPRATGRMNLTRHKGVSYRGETRRDTTHSTVQYSVPKGPRCMSHVLYARNWSVPVESILSSLLSPSFLSPFMNLFSLLSWALHERTRSLQSSTLRPLTCCPVAGQTEMPLGLLLTESHQPPDPGVTFWCRANRTALIRYFQPSSPAPSPCKAYGCGVEALSFKVSTAPLSSFSSPQRQGGNRVRHCISMRHVFQKMTISTVI
jgi:hypothetical protein